MYVTPNSLWLVGKPHEILQSIAKLKKNNVYVTDIINQYTVLHIPPQQMLPKRKQYLH